MRSRTYCDIDVGTTAGTDVDDAVLTSVPYEERGMKLVMGSMPVFDASV
jgi:hypothetical protein